MNRWTYVTDTNYSFKIQDFLAKMSQLYKLLLSICFNSLTPGKFEWNFRYVIFKRILVIDGWGISCEIALMWMSLDLTDVQSPLIQVMPWCCQATSHYLSQFWPISLSPYGVTRPQWVNLFGGITRIPQKNTVNIMAGSFFLPGHRQSWYWLYWIN